MRADPRQPACAGSRRSGRGGATAIVRPLIDCRRVDAARRRRAGRAAVPPRRLERRSALPAHAGAAARAAAARRAQSGGRRGVRQPGRVGARRARRRGAAGPTPSWRRRESTDGLPVAWLAGGSRPRRARCWRAAGWCAPACRGGALDRRHVRAAVALAAGRAKGGAEVHLPLGWVLERGVAGELAVDAS